MTACLTCGGFAGRHDNYAHGTGDYAGDVYGIDPPDPDDEWDCTCGDTFNPQCPEHGGNEHRP